jgi:hypothetical protein
MDLQPLKVPIFPNVNNIPQPPTALQAGNGSDLIARYNNLIDVLSVPAGIHTDEEIYVSAINGNDANNGKTYETAYKTIKAAVAWVSTKKINRYFRIWLEGTFNEPIDLSAITGVSLAGDPSFLEIDNFDQGSLTLGGQDAIVPPKSPSVKVEIDIPQWIVTSSIEVFETKRLLTIKGDFVLSNAFNDSSIFSLWRSDIAFQAIFDSIGRTTSFFEATDSKITLYGGTFSGFTQRYMGLCKSCLVYLTNSPQGTGNAFSLSLTEGTILATNNHTFVSGNYFKDPSSYITNGSVAVLPPPA